MRERERERESAATYSFVSKRSLLHIDESGSFEWVMGRPVWELSQIQLQRKFMLHLSFCVVAKYIYILIVVFIF